ncbi:MAG: hypothetical protein ICV83_19045 [Cytophagales bacterium]|nr:hypothetical protein [Cytophagales bacterium]
MSFQRPRLVPLFLCFALAFTVSCKKDEADAIRPAAKDPSANTKSDIRLGNGYLEFKTPQVFEQTLQNLTNKTKEEVAAWEKQYGFTSMRTLYEQALQAELTAASAGIDGHSDFVTEHKKMLVLHEDGTIDMNNFHTDAAAVVNEDGIVKVAGHFYQYTKNHFKVLEGGAETKLDLLKQATESNESASITVTKVIVESSNRAKSGRTSLQNLSEYCNSEWQNFQMLRGEIQLALYQKPIHSTTPVLVEYCEWDEFNMVYNCRTWYEYPIIGYSNQQRLYLISKGGVWRKPLFSSTRWFDSGYWYYKEIDVYYKVDYGTQRNFRTWVYNSIELFGTVYDGPGSNISANIQFSGRPADSHSSFYCYKQFD